MPRKRDPRRDKAFELWKESKGKRKLKDIAAELEISDSQIRKWKSQDKWNDKLKGNVTNSKRSVTKQKSTNRIRDATPQKEEKEESLQSDELTDKQRFFCMYYLKYFSAAKAYQKAYGCAYDTAKAHGYKLLRNVAIKQEIDEMKEEQANGILLDARFVLQKYIDIAFADVTDYTIFGKKEVQQMGMFGPVEDDEGNPVMKEINYVDFKESNEIDGTIITEVKQGKDGVSIKLADKMKALDKLWDYFDMLPESTKDKLQQEKLKADIAKSKAEIEKINSKDDDNKEKDVAAALRGLVDGINSKTD
ncbi:terminase small subunit [Virgibacillus doumboii]|uniref:terminase small subunit n=1 Tax=Virgibacillus doumboii TaxID=2697503 RepID=UPI0013E07229|nr:terminase small subunit [Virgibacillus doumboii]